MLPALSGHTMTSVTHDTSALLLIGGITEQLNWNLNVYVYNNSQWTAMNDSGASPSGKLHSLSRVTFCMSAYAVCLIASCHVLLTIL